MSKMDDLRAMREARYGRAEARAKAAAPAKAPKAPPARATAATAPTTSPVSAVVPEPAAEAEPALCGHRNMSGRTCTREAGHAAKSHRYA
jgi:hypothetical protein